MSLAICPVINQQKKEMNLKSIEKNSETNLYKCVVHSFPTKSLQDKIEDYFGFSFHFM